MPSQKNPLKLFNNFTTKPFTNLKPLQFLTSVLINASNETICSQRFQLIWFVLYCLIQSSLSLNEMLTSISRLRLSWFCEIISYVFIINSPQLKKEIYVSSETIQCFVTRTGLSQNHLPIHLIKNHLFHLTNFPIWYKIWLCDSHQITIIIMRYLSV